MKIKILYHASFSDILGREEETLLAEALTLSDLLDTLLAKNGDQFRELLIDPLTGDISPGVVVLLNHTLHPPGTQLRDGDEVAFLMSLAGG